MDGGGATRKGRQEARSRGGRSALRKTARSDRRRATPERAGRTTRGPPGATSRRSELREWRAARYHLHTSGRNVRGRPREESSDPARLEAAAPRLSPRRAHQLPEPPRGPSLSARAAAETSGQIMAPQSAIGTLPVP